MKSTAKKKPMDTSLVDAPPESGATIEHWISQFLKVRKKLEEYDEGRKRFTSVMEELRGVMRDQMQAMGVNSLNTDSGSCYLTTSDTARVIDPDKFMKYVMDNGAYWLVERRAAKNACKDHLEEHGSLPPGVLLNVVETVGVRSPTEK